VSNAEKTRRERVGDLKHPSPHLDSAEPEETRTEQQPVGIAPTWEARANAAIVDLSKALISQRSIEDVSFVVLERAKELTGSRFGYVGYIDPDTGHLVCSTMTRDIWDMCQVADKDVVFEEFTGLWGWVLENREPLLSNAPAEDVRSIGVPDGHIPITRFLSVPAMIDDELIGQVALANSDREYAERDLALVEQLASLYALTIQRQRAEGKLRRQARALEKRVRELNCIYDISALVEKPRIALQEILQGTVDLIPQAWRYPEITYARLTLRDKIFRSQGGACCQIRTSPWFQSEEIRVRGEVVGSLEVCYTEERPKADEGPFLHEERGLLKAIAERLGRVIERLENEEALRRERNRLEQIMETNPLGVTMVDRSGQLTFANTPAEEILGLTKDEISHRTYDDPKWHITDEEGGPFPEEALPFHRVTETEEPVYDVRHAIEWPNGKRVLLSINAAPLFDEFGQMSGMVATLEDITERKRAEEERVKQLERELRNLEHLTESPNTSTTAQMYGLSDLRSGLPNVFDALVQRYKELIDRAFERRIYQVDYDISGELSAIAEKLGALKANPRDLIDIHITALKEQGKTLNPVRAQAYAEEGRLLTLELMGNLVSYYRNHLIPAYQRPPSKLQEGNS
jgi:PAS domain S-box-containing protein